MDEKKLSWKWLVPGFMQLPVCLGLTAMGFQFEDLKSLVMFLYAFSYIMFTFKAFFHKDFDESAKDRYWPIAVLDAVIQLGFQLWGFYYVVVGVSKLYNNKNNSSDSFGEENPTFISAILIFVIELVLVGNLVFQLVIMVWKIYKLQWHARLSKYWSKKFLEGPQSDETKSTNSKKDVEMVERNEDQNPLLNKSTDSENSGKEKES